MRSLTAALALVLLTACGQPAQAPSTGTEAESSGPAWRVALTDNPEMVRSYAPAGGLAALPNATVEAVADGSVKITTAPGPRGAWAAMLTLGDDARQERQMAVRVRAKVDAGALYFVSTYDHAAQGYQPQQERVAAGETVEILLPVDKTGAPLFVVANASDDGASVGSVTAVELLAAPAAH